MEHATYNKELKKKRKHGVCSMFHVPCSTSESGAAFTILELLVVVAIVSVLTGIVAINILKIQNQLAFSRVSYKFEQDVKRAQELSLSLLQYKDSNGIVQPVGGFGVYVKPASDNKDYIIYADLAPFNHYYDIGDIIVEDDNFSSTEHGVIIKQINNVVSPDVSINFAGPQPITIITSASGQNSVDVVFALEANPAITKTVSVNTAGLIEVK